MSNSEQNLYANKTNLEASELLDHPVHGISLLLTPYSKVDKVLILNRVIYYLIKAHNINADIAGMFDAMCMLSTPPNELVDTKLTEIIMNNLTLENEHSLEELFCNIFKGLDVATIVSEVIKLTAALLTFSQDADMKCFEKYVDTLRKIVQIELQKKVKNKEVNFSDLVKDRIKINDETIAENTTILFGNSTDNLTKLSVDELEPEKILDIINALCNSLYNVLIRQDIVLRKAVLNELNFRMSVSHVDNPSEAIN